MSKRSDNISFKMMPNGNIRAFRTDKADKRGVSELMITFGGGISPTILTAHVPMFYTIKRIE